jgi:hypothetical protein
MAHRISAWVAARLVLAMGVSACALVVLVPRETHADDSDEVQEWERSGEIVADDEGNLKGQKFGEVIARGDLTRTANGWVLVRTFENTSEEAQSLVVEEKMTKQLTAHYARVSPPAVTLVLRTQRAQLKPHETKTVGIMIPAAVSAQIDESARIKAAIEHEEKRMAESDEPANSAIMRQTYQDFRVAYLSPLPPGKRAAKPPETGVTRPTGLADFEGF